MTELASPPTNQEIVKWIKRVNIGVLFLGLILLAVPVIGAWWISAIADDISGVTISNIRVVGPTNLCPGGRLFWSYDLIGSGSGLLEIDGTTYKAHPPSTVVFSETGRMVISEEVSEKVVDFWEVPLTHIDQETGESIPFPVGEFHRLIAVSSPTRSSVFAKEVISFSVLSDCNGG